MTLEGARRVRDDRDRPRVGCRGDRHDRHLRRGEAAVRHRHPVPRRVEGLPRQRRAARHRGRRLRPAHHEGRQPRRARVLRAASATRRAASCTGIGGEDDGLKGGLNGIDNGRLHFTNVRVPRDEPAEPLRRRRRGRHLLEPDREPRPPLLHDARHARAGPRLARRRRDVGARPWRSRSRSPTATSAASSTPRATPTRRCCSTTSGTSAACSRSSRRPTRRSSRTTSSS